jgi:hypothetical protein
MAEFNKALLTSALTLIGGCLIFVFQRFLLEPLNEQSRVIGRVSFAMHYYGREYNSPLIPKQADQETREHYWAVGDKLRELASSLAESSQAVRPYWLWRLLKMTPDRENIDAVIGLLTRMSNSLFVLGQEQYREQVKQNWKDADEIIKQLGLRRWGK